MIDMERKIGEIFELGGEWYQCIKGMFCNLCAFGSKMNCARIYTKGRCSAKSRNDEIDVIFKKLEKVGEPINYMCRTFQKLKCPDTERCKYCYFGNQVCNPQLCGEESFLVEIKQTKEDNPLTRLVYNYINGKISDKDLIESIKELTDKYPYTQNLKEFDLEQAKAGKPVHTRDGREARVICFDAKGMHQPIIALITQDNGVEYIETYYSNGRFNDDINSQSDYDLIMLPEKK